MYLSLCLNDSKTLNVPTTNIKSSVDQIEKFTEPLMAPKVYLYLVLRPLQTLSKTFRVFGRAARLRTEQTLN